MSVHSHELPLKARAIGFIQAFDEALGPKYDCAPATMPSLVIDPYNFAIEQQRDRLVFTYEKDDIVRTIWLNGAGPKPTVYDQYWQGHSVGRYEDGVLIVETTKFPFDPTGLDDMYNIPSSTQKRVIERYWRDGDALKADIVTEDPLFLTQPVQFQFEWQRTDERSCCRTRATPSSRSSRCSSFRRSIRTRTSSRCRRCRARRRRR